MAKWDVVTGKPAFRFAGGVVAVIAHIGVSRSATLFGSRAKSALAMELM